MCSYPGAWHRLISVRQYCHQLVYKESLDHHFSQWDKTSVLPLDGCRGLSLKQQLEEQVERARPWRIPNQMVEGTGLENALFRGPLLFQLCLCNKA